MDASKFQGYTTMLYVHDIITTMQTEYETPGQIGNHVFAAGDGHVAFISDA